MAERKELKPVSCSHCSHFKPDTIGFGQGLGQCAIVEAETIPMEKQRRFVECGSKLCYNGSDKPNRLCQHYVAKYPFTVGD